MLFPKMSADELDDLVDPDGITGIEVYTISTAPPQFQTPLESCGSIVIWKREGAGSRGSSVFN